MKTLIMLSAIPASGKTTWAKKYQDEIEVIANNIIYGSKRFVLLSGPSSSGKTTTSHMIAKHLNTLGKGCVYISLDDFFINRDQTPILPDGKYDFENFDILDLDKINSCITDFASLILCLLHSSITSSNFFASA